MKKVLSASFLSVLVFLFGIFFFLDRVHAEPRRITCEEWMRIALSDECRYYNLNTKEKNQIKDLEVYCFSEPAIITERGSSYDFEIKSRPPDYIAAFEWDKCGAGGVSGGNKTKPSSSNSKTSPDSLDCKVLLQDLRESGKTIRWMDLQGETYMMQKQVVERKNGDYCEFVQKIGETDENSIRLDKKVKITYLDPVPNQIPLPQDANFEVIDSSNTDYDGVTVIGEHRDVMSEAEFRYKAVGINYAKAGSFVGKCLVEVMHAQDFDIDSQNTNSKEELRDYIITMYSDVVKDQRNDAIQNSLLQAFCGGSDGIASSSNPISQFFSKLFNFIINIFKPASQKTLGIETSLTQENQSQQLASYVIIGGIVGVVIWFLAKKPPSLKKRTKKKRRKRK